MFPAIRGAAVALALTAAVAPSTAGAGPSGARVPPTPPSPLGDGAGESRAGSLSLTPGAAPTVVNLYDAPPANGFYVSGAGAVFSLASVDGHVPGDTLRAMELLQMTTRSGFDAQETGIFVNLTNNKGAVNGYLPNTAYPPGSAVVSGGNIYTTVNGGRTGADSAPAGTTGPRRDGTVTWTYFGDQINNGKTGIAVGQVVRKGGGTAWGMAIDVSVENGAFPPVAGGGAITSEFDLNGAGSAGKDCPPATPGACQTFDILLGGTATAAWQNTVGVLGGGSGLDGSGAQTFFTHWGFALLTGFAKDVAYLDATTATAGFYASGTRQGPGFATFKDTATGAYGMTLQGTYAAAALDLTAAKAGRNPAISMAAGQAIAFNSGDFRLGYQPAAGVLAVTVGGNVVGYIDGSGGLSVRGLGVGRVPTSGTVAALAFHEVLRTPASSRAACSAGDFTDDANYHYVCIATNTWKRVALSSF